MNYTNLIVMAIIATATNVHAKDVQWAHGYTANCINATERDDAILDDDGNVVEAATPLDPSEINMVRYLIVPVGGTLDNPTYEIQMTGGCQPALVDTRHYVPVGSYLLYGITVDNTQPINLESAGVIPGVPLNVMKSRPKDASGLE